MGIFSPIPSLSASRWASSSSRRNRGGPVSQPFHSRSALVYFGGRAALMWCLIKILRWTCAGKWCPEESGRWERAAIISAFLSKRWRGLCQHRHHRKPQLLIFFLSASIFDMFPAGQNEDAASKLLMFTSSGNLSKAVCPNALLLLCNSNNAIQ